MTLLLRPVTKMNLDTGFTRLVDTAAAVRSTTGNISFGMAWWLAGIGFEPGNGKDSFTNRFHGKRGG